MVADAPPGPAEQWTRQIARETPVEDRCLWCKIEPEASDSGVEFVPVGDDELLCSRCRKDLREFKRSVHVQYWASTGLAASVRRLLKDVWQDHIQPELDWMHTDDGELYLMPYIKSGAQHHDNPGLEAIEELEHDRTPACGGDSNSS